MKKFIQSILLFILPLVLGNLLLNSIVNRVYNDPYLQHPKAAKFTRFLFADSHGLPLGNTLEGADTYNFSAGSDSYSDILRKLIFLNKHVKVDRLLLIADDHTLSKYRDMNNNDDRSIQLLSYEDFKSTDSAAGWFDFFKKKYLSGYIIFFNPKARDILKAFFRGWTDPVVQESKWDILKDKKAAAKERADLQFPDTLISQVQRKALLDIISICKSGHIELIGIKFPLAKEYASEVGLRNYGADSLLRAHGVRVLDYKNIFFDKDSFFANQDHLNKQGGVELSSFVSKELGQ